MLGDVHGTGRDWKPPTVFADCDATWAWATRATCQWRCPGCWPIWLQLLWRSWLFNCSLGRTLLLLHTLATNLLIWQPLRLVFACKSFSTPSVAWPDYSPLVYSSLFPLMSPIRLPKAGKTHNTVTPQSGHVVDPIITGSEVSTCHRRIHVASTPMMI